MATGEWICGGTTPQGWAIVPGEAGTVLTSQGVGQKPTFEPVGASSLPSGLIVMWAGLLSAIPSGWLLCDGTNGTPDLRSLFIKGAAPGVDPGTTGGAATHTPTGTVSTPIFTGSGATTSAVSAGTPAGTNSAPTFTGDAVTSSAVSAGTPVGTNSTVSFTPAGTVAAPVFTGSALGTHTHTYTDVPNHVHVQTVNSATTGGLSGYTPDTSTNSGVSSGYSTANPTGGVATGTTAGTSAGTPAGTNSAPAFTGQAGTVPAQTFTGSALGTHTHSVTATGTVSAPTFTGSALGTHTHTVTASGTLSEPVFTGDDANYEPAYVALAFLMKS